MTFYIIYAIIIIENEREVITMMTGIIGFAVTFISALAFANYLDKNRKEQLKRERKLNREDLALHDLTSCRED